MTNTLHRFGDEESFRDDFVVICVPSRGRNDENIVPKLRKFLQMALKYKPVNLGDARHGGVHRPSRNMNPLSHWKRDIKPNFDAVIAGFDTATTAAAVFDNHRSGRSVRHRRAQGGSRSERQHLDVDQRRAQMLRGGGDPPSQRGLFAGFRGKDREHLPSADVLSLSTMCGHGMVSTSLAKKMIDWVREGRRTPAQACTYLSRFCSCGIFNPARAERILEDARGKNQ